MKKKILLLSLCLVMMSGCGTKVPKLENGKDAIVTFKDGSMISTEELYEEMKDTYNYGMKILVNLIDEKILQDKYKDKMSEVDDYVNNHKAQLDAQYGADLLAAVRQNTTYYTIEDYLNSVRLSYLQNLTITDYAKSQITDKEIEKYYESDIVGDIKVNHILITAKVTDDMKSDEKKEAEAKAKAEIEEIIKTLKATKKEDLESKFIELAKEKSEDDSTKDSGGSLGYINKGTLGTYYKELEEAAYKLKDGEFSTSVITTEVGYHVIIRLDSKNKPSLEDAKSSILDTLGSKYIQENSSTISVKAMQEARKEYGVEIQDSEIKTRYAAYIQGVLAPKEEDKTETNK